MSGCRGSSTGPLESLLFLVRLVRMEVAFSICRPADPRLRGARVCENSNGGVYWVLGTGSRVSLPPVKPGVGRPGQQWRGEGNNLLAPVSLSGAGVRPYFPSLSLPRMRGMARLKAHGLDFARPA